MSACESSWGSRKSHSRATRALPNEFFRCAENERFRRAWYKEAGRAFIPARKEDNPTLDQRSYEQAMSKLDPVTRAQLDRGDVLAKDDIEKREPSPVSTMPDGLGKRFTEEEFVDLIAFLVSLKDDRAP